MSRKWAHGVRLICYREGEGMGAGRGGASVGAVGLVHRRAAWLLSARGGDVTQAG